MAARALLLSGGLGTGKTAVAKEVVAEAAERRMAAAAVDLDWLGWATGAGLSVDDLIARNLSALAGTYRDCGVGHLVLARGVVSGQALAAIGAALAGWELRVIRLQVSRATAERRLRARDTGAELDGHLRELDELAARVAAATPEAPVVSTDGRALPELAREVMRLGGWIDD